MDGHGTTLAGSDGEGQESITSTPNNTPEPAAPSIEIPEAVYASRPIKRHRRGNAEIADFKTALYNIVAEQKPMSVRQVFYQAVCRSLIEKTEAGYGKVQRALVQMRREDHLPFDWIADYTRYRIKPRTYDSVQDALERTAKFYRRSLWNDADAYVEIWCEKQALQGVIHPVTDEYDVSLMISRGFSSITFLQEAGEYMQSLERPCYIYQFGDYDRSGLSISENIKKGLAEFAPNAEIYFDRVAVNEWQIEHYNLPTRPPKKDEKSGPTRCVELDAIPPEELRQLVRTRIENHIDTNALAALELTEKTERQSIRHIAAQFGGAA